MSKQSKSVLGVGVDAVDLETTLEAISSAISRRTAGYIVLAPAHNVLAAYDAPDLRRAFAASLLTVPDGMGVVWFLKAAGAQGVGRVYGPDLLLAACQRGLQPGWRHYFLGGPPGLADRLAAILQERYPGLRVAGTQAPPFGPMLEDEIEDILEQIESSRADIVWVGLGSPKQERWMAAYRGRLSAPLLVGVGAAFDFLTGAKAQAPAWVQRSGLEWLYRLLSEPRRLWRRYAQYPRFGLLALAQLTGLRDFPLESRD